jgi:hypothetical protein
MQLAPSALVLIIAVLRSSFDFRTAEAWRQNYPHVGPLFSKFETHMTCDSPFSL